MEVVYAQQGFPESVTKTVFLAGPTHRTGQEGAVSWRHQALNSLRRRGFDGHVFVPEPVSGVWQDNYEGQVVWEDEGLRRADVILFWVTRDLEILPGFTTNIEWGAWFDSEKVVYGRPEGTPKVSYMDHNATSQGVVIHTDLEHALSDVMGRLGAGELRVGVEAKVPLVLWRSLKFRREVADARDRGSEIEAIEVGPSKFGHVAKITWTQHRAALDERSITFGLYPPEVQV